MLFNHPTPQWQRALERSDAALIRVKRTSLVRDSVGDRIITLEKWRATSSEEPTEFVYELRIINAPGATQISCECRGGMKNRPCRHSAEVLRTKGLLAPKPQPVRTAAVMRENAALLRDVMGWGE